MKLEEMAVLVRVAQAGSMTLAARQLHITPAAVSATVRRIEAALGVRLFERTTRALHPTAEGLTVLEGCEDVAARWQQTLEALHGSTRALTGTIHITTPADTAAQIVSPVVAALSRAHPRLQIVVHPSDAVQHLHRDAIDLAIRYGPLEDSALTARKLADCPGVLVAAPAYLARHGAPSAPGELATHRCVTLQLSSVAATSWSLFQAGQTVQVELRSALCGDGLLARNWAIAGLGIARKSLIDVIDDLEAGRLVRVLPGWTAGTSPIHVVFPSRRFLPARVRALDEALRAAFGARMARCVAWLDANAPGAWPDA